MLASKLVCCEEIGLQREEEEEQLHEESKRCSKTDDLIGLSDKRRSQLLRSRAHAVIDLTKRKMAASSLASQVPHQQQAPSPARQPEPVEESKEPSQIVHLSGKATAFNPAKMSKKRVRNDF